MFFGLIRPQMSDITSPEKYRPEDPETRNVAKHFWIIVIQAGTVTLFIYSFTPTNGCDVRSN